MNLKHIAFQTLTLKPVSYFWSFWVGGNSNHSLFV